MAKDKVPARMSMKDFVGNDVVVGDYIFYSTTGRYAETRLCIVTRFTAKTMFVVPVATNRNRYSDPDEVAVQNDFIKVHPEYLESYTMKKLSE